MFILFHELDELSIQRAGADPEVRHSNKMESVHYYIEK